MVEIATKEDFIELSSKVDMIMEKLGILPIPELTIRDIAKRHKVSYNYTKYTAPYLMPNNGKSEFPGVIRWTKTTVDAWEQIPLSERRLAWEKQLKEEALQKLKEQR